MNEYLKLQEKKEIFKTATFIGIAYLFLPIFSLQFMNLYTFVFSLFTKMNRNEIVTLVSSSLVSAATYNIVFTTICFLLPYILITKFAFKSRVSDIVKTDKPDCNIFMTLSLVVLGLGVCQVGNFASFSLASFIEKVFGVTPIQNNFSDPTSFFEIVFSFVAIAVIPALLEEFAFRGVILGLLTKIGKWNAIIISSILFSFMHGNFVQIPFSLCVGIVLGYVTVATNSIWPAIIIHALNNFLATLSSYTDIVFVLFFVFMVFAVSVFIYLLVNRPFKDRVSEGMFFNTSRKRFLIFISNPLIIISLLLLIVEAIFMVQ